MDHWCRAIQYIPGSKKREQNRHTTGIQVSPQSLNSLVVYTLATDNSASATPSTGMWKHVLWHDIFSALINPDARRKFKMIYGYGECWQIYESIMDTKVHIHTNIQHASDTIWNWGHLKGRNKHRYRRSRLPISVVVFVCCVHIIAWECFRKQRIITRIIGDYFGN